MEGIKRKTKKEKYREKRDSAKAEEQKKAATSEVTIKKAKKDKRLKASFVQQKGQDSLLAHGFSAVPDHQKVAPSIPPQKLHQPLISSVIGRF